MAVNTFLHQKIERDSKSILTKLNIFQLVRQLDKYRCQVWGCGCRDNLEVHHIIPRSQGGEDLEDNLITLCQEHHRMITEGKMSDIDMLEKLKKKRYFRWQRALDWHAMRSALKELKIRLLNDSKT